MSSQLRTFKDLFSSETKLPPFKPTATIIPNLDRMLYLEKDCSYTTRYVPGTNIALLCESGDPKKVVGVQIDGFKMVANFTIVEK